jgi:hypothetical protein
MNERDFTLWNTSGNQLGFDVVIDREFSRTGYTRNIFAGKELETFCFDIVFVVVFVDLVLLYFSCRFSLLDPALPLVIVGQHTVSIIFSVLFSASILNY